jgi:hypothetical protein
MDIRRAFVRLIQGADANVAQFPLPRQVAAEHRHAAFHTPGDDLTIAAWGRQCHFSNGPIKSDPVGLDDRIQYKCRPGQTLTFAAVTAMRDYRPRFHAVGYGTACTSSIQHNDLPSSLLPRSFVHSLANHIGGNYGCYRRIPDAVQRGPECTHMTQCGLSSDVGYVCSFIHWAAH